MGKTKNKKLQNTQQLDSGESPLALFTQIFKTVGGVLLALIIIRFYIFQPFSITGSSMEPTFYDKEYLIVDELSYIFTNPQRGDVIVFKHPEPACNDHISSGYINRKFIQGPCSNYIKRIIGVPGDTITIKDGEVNVKNKKNPNGLTLEENYTPSNIPTLGNQTITLGEKEYFVMGDNRGPNSSSDSREWGALPESHIIGKALVVLLPPDDFGFVKTPYY